MVNGVAESDSGGLLSSLLGAGCECEGYNLRIVGHSLGGAIAALLGVRVWFTASKSSCLNAYFIASWLIFFK